MFEQRARERAADPAERNLTMNDRIARMTPEQLAAREEMTAALIEIIREQRAALHADTADGRAA